MYNSSKIATLNLKNTLHVAAKREIVLVLSMQRFVALPTPGIQAGYVYVDVCKITIPIIKGKDEYNISNHRVPQVWYENKNKHLDAIKGMVLKNNKYLYLFASDVPFILQSPAAPGTYDQDYLRQRIYFQIVVFLRRAPLLAKFMLI